MNDFRFASPNYLALLLVLGAVYLLLAWVRSRGRERLLRFVSEQNLSRLMRSTGTLSEKGKRLALWAGLVMLVIALARPQANPQIEDVEGMSLDIYVLLDLSRSMDAEDIPPSRLRKAKRSIQHLMELLSGDRIGVIGFAGTSALFVPLTSDYEIVKSVLQNVDTSAIPSQGTDLAGALELAKNAMDRGAQSVGSSGSRTNIFVVMSDGEDHGAGKLDIVNDIRNEGGVIFSIAFGTEKGVPIPVRDDSGVLQGYKRDPRGNTVLTTVQPKTLSEIAQRGGGQFYFSTLEEKEIEDILTRVQTAQRTGAITTKARVYEEFFVPVLALALALLLYSFVSIRGLLSRRKASALAVLALMASSHSAMASPLSLFWNKEKRVSEDSLNLSKSGKPEAAADQFKTLQAENPDSPAVNYNLGTYLLEAKKLNEGREQLKRVAKDKNYYQPDALYNLAGSYMLEKKKPEAMAGYAELIRQLEKKSPLTGKEQEILTKAKKNFAQLSQEEQKNQQSQQGNNPDNQQNQQNQDQKSQDQKNQDQKNQQNGNQGDKSKPDEQKDKDKDKEKDKNSDDQKKDQNGEKPEDKPQDTKDQKDQKDQGQDEKKKDQGQDQKQNENGQGNPPPRRLGGQPFRERDNISESDAKRILESLKEQEGSLQKKFLKKNGKNSKVNEDANGQDW